MTLRERLENFAHFGAETNPTIKNTLLIGDQINTFFSQSSEDILDIELQLFIFSLIWYGIWKNKDSKQLTADIKSIAAVYGKNEAFKKNVQDLINKEDNLNSLLTSLQKQAGKILTEGGISI